MKILIMKTQKAQKHVIKYALLLSVLGFVNCYSQSNNSDPYYFIEKVIKLNRDTDSNEYRLSENVLSGKGVFSEYYKYRYKNKPIYTVFAVDSLTNNLGIDSVRLKRDTQRWDHQYAILDSIFTKKEIEAFLKREKKYPKWDKDNNIFTQNISFNIDWCTYYCHSISMPYLNTKKDIALIIITSNRVISSSILIFKRNADSWRFVKKIKNIGS